MKSFKFNVGLYDDWSLEGLDMTEPMDPEGFFGADFDETPQQYGLLRDMYQNRLNDTLDGYLPYEEWFGNRLYYSELVFRSFNEWRELIENDRSNVYNLYSVIRIGNDGQDRELIDLFGQSEMFPLFAILNPEQQYHYEFIKYPRQ